MTDALRLGRRTFTIAVVGATIAWSIGLAAVLQPLTAQGAMAGDLIKGSLPAVYYYGADGRRYVFPNEKTFNTWYSGFSGVQTLSDAEIAAIPIGGNVVYRGGTRLIKIQTDPRVYAVELNGVIRWVESEAVASALYGAAWASRVDDVPDVFFVDYTPGAALSSAASYPAGSLVSPADSDAVYYITSGGQKRMVDAAGLSANGFMSSHVIETSQNLSVYADGAALSARDSALADASQTGGAAAAPGTAPGATVAGGLTVSLASDTPASVTVARGASSVGLLALNLSAAGGDVTLTALTLKRVGVGAVADWANLYLYQNGSRLTDGRTINTQTHEVVFSGLSLAVASGSTVKLWLKGDVAVGAGANTHAFQLASAAGVQSSASAVNGSLPITGNSMTIGAATAGTLTLDVTGTIANPVLGSQQAEIARFTMAAATEDALIHSIVFRIDGSVRGGDLRNFTLKQGNTVVGTAANASADGRFVVMSMSTPYSLLNGFTRTFSLNADIGGDANRTIGIRVEHAADVVVLGSSFNQGMQVAVAGYNGGTGDDAARAACGAAGQDCSFSTIQGSTLTYAFNGPVAADLASNSQDNVFMKFNITAQQWTRIDEFALIVRCDATSGSGCDVDNDDGDLLRGTNAAATEANLKDIKIRRVGGGTVMGPLELSLAGADNTQTLTYTEDLVLQSGQTLQLEITADIDNNAVAADVFEIVVDVSTIVAEDANGDTVAAANITPSADIVGNNMTIRTATLTITHSVPPSDAAAQTTIRGTSGKDAVGFSFAAGQGSSSTITAFTLSTYVDGDTATDVNDFIEGTETEADGGASIASTDIVSSVSLYDSTTGALVAGPENVRTAPAGNVVFDNFTWTVPAGQTKKLIARANVANYTVAGEADAFAFRIDQAADITAQDQDGATVTATLTGNMNGTATTPTTFIRIANNGTLNSSLDADAPRADIVLAGATNVVLSKVRFDAVNEGFLIDRFQVDERGAGVTDVGTTAGDYDNNISAVTLSYPKQDGSTGTATSFMVGGTADFTLAQGSEIYVAKDRNATVTVMVSFQTIENGATRGEKPLLAFDADANFQAKGVSSGATITATTNGTDATGRQMVVRETQPTIAIAAGNPTTGVAGLAEVLRLTVAAAAGEAAVLDILTFKVTATDNNGEAGAGADDWNECRAAVTAGALDASDFNLFDRSALSQQLESADTDWTMLDASGMTCDNAGDNLGFVRLNLTNPEVIAAGTTKTYSLEADTTGAATANDDTVRFEIPADLVNSTFLAGADVGGASQPDEVNGALTGVATTVAADDGGDGTLAQTNIVAGDYICFDENNGGTCGAAEEIALVTAVAGNNLTVVRGAFGRAQQVIDDNSDLLRMPSTIIWDDDGDSSTVNPVSGYLLDTLPAVGSTFVY